MLIKEDLYADDETEGEEVETTENDEKKVPDEIQPPPT